MNGKQIQIYQQATPLYTQTWLYTYAVFLKALTQPACNTKAALIKFDDNVCTSGEKRFKCPSKNVW